MITSDDTPSLIEPPPPLPNHATVHPYINPSINHPPQELESLTALAHEAESVVIRKMGQAEPGQLGQTGGEEAAQGRLPHRLSHLVHAAQPLPTIVYNIKMNEIGF